VTVKETSSTTYEKGMTSASSCAVTKGKTVQGATSSSASTMRVIALVPNDVKEVRITDKDGASYTVGVTDNIAVSRDVNATSLAYRLGNGKEQRASVATLINRTPN